MNRRKISSRVAREVDDELAFHTEMRVRELMQKGMSEDEARAEADRRLGDVEVVKTRMRREGERRDLAMNRRIWWDELGQDIRFALRQLKAAPGFGLVAVMTLALAIGAGSAVFTVVNGVLLKPLPYSDPAGLVRLDARYLPESGFDLPFFSMSGPEYLDLKEGTQVLSNVAVYQGGAAVNLTGEGQTAERVSASRASAEVAAVLGVRPHLGRWFSPEESIPDAPRVIVLSHELWAARFGADSTLVGTSIPVDGVPLTVVGVMPEEFEFAGAPQLWVSLSLDRTNEGGRGQHGYTAVGRLASGMTMTDLQDELERFKASWAADYEHNVGHFLVARGLHESVVGADAPRTLNLMMGAVGLILLVACANIANLLLARGERRSSEIAVRVAMGAGQGRILRQLITESTVISMAAAVVGLGLAVAAIPALVGIAPTALPRLSDARPDHLVLAITVITAFATTLVFGVAPAMIAARRGVKAAASAAAKVASTRRASAVRRTLVTIEVGLCVVVVLMAGLLVRSYRSLAGTDPGLVVENLVMFNLSLPSASYPEDELVHLEFRRLTNTLSQLPGVTAVTAGSLMPFATGWGQWDFQLEGRPPRQEGDRAWNAAIAMVGANYFETLGLPLIEGRGILETDDAGAPWVGVVNETFANLYFPGESAIGKRWGYQQSEDSITWITVVGVAADPRLGGITAERQATVWFPTAQAGLSGYFWPRTQTFAIRATRDAEALMPLVRSTVRDFDSDLPVYAVTTMETEVADSMARPRLTASLLGLFGVIAMGLAAVGIYGVISYSVAGRTREIGVRVALGAERRDVLGLVVKEGARPVLVGLVLGLAGAWFAKELVASMLFGVTSTDVLTFVTVPLVLLVVGIVASWVPAMRATRVPPTEALRAE